MSNFLSLRVIQALGGSLLAAGIWFLYGGHIDAPLIFDDLDFFSGNYVSKFGSTLQPFLSRYWPFASFAHQSLLFEHGTAEMRIGNIVLHGLCTLSLQRLIARLLASTEETGTASPTVSHELVAFTAAGLFAVHPAAVYTVAYLIERTMLMATLFSLLMWLAWLSSIQSGKKIWCWVSVLCFYFAAFSKQHAVLTPIVPLALSILFWRETQTRLGWRVLIPVFVAYAGIAIAVTLPSASILGTAYEPMLVYFLDGDSWHERLYLLERIHWMSILTQCGLFFKYLLLWLWPNPEAMSIDMREVFLADLSAPSNWLGVLAYLCFGLLSAGLLWRGRRSVVDGSRTGPALCCGLLGLGLMIPWGLFLVELMTVRLQEIFVLYRSYLWMTGLTIALAVVLNALVVRLRTSAILLACIPLAVFLTYATQQRMQTLASEKLLWEDAVRLIERRNLRVIGAERAYNNRGVAYAKAGDLPRALADYEKAISLNPRYYASFQSRGQLMMELGQFDGALASFDRVLVIRPGYTKARIYRGFVLERMEMKSDALAEFMRACDEGDSWACYLHHKRTKPGTDLIFKPKEK